MIRREFLGALGLGSAAGAVVGGSKVVAAADPQLPDSGSRSPIGGLNLSDIPVIDTHMHAVSRTLLSAGYARQANTFTEAVAPAGEFSGRDEMLTTMKKGFVDLIWGQPRRIGYMNYMARVYGVPATLEGFDSVVQQHIKSDADFTAYITSIFDREKIATVVLQSEEADPKRPPSTAIPQNRFVWTWPFHQMFVPSWAKKNDATSLQDVLALIDKTMEDAVASGCRGFKNNTAYYRPFTLAKVTKSEADSALRALLVAKPSAYNLMDVPVYSDESLNAQLRTYEDYLFRHVYVRAGQLERPVIIHTAVALHPALRTDFNNPQPLYDIFRDAEIQKAGTRFILIHSGYPSHHIVASMISQFPNVYTDVSFFAKYPGVLEEIYRAFLALAPSEKIMHGSDANTVPEEIGYCAWNSRAVLARVLGEYKAYGWTENDLMQAANNILHDNARKIFRIAV